MATGHIMQCKHDQTNSNSIKHVKCGQAWSNMVKQLQVLSMWFLDASGCFWWFVLSMPSFRLLFVISDMPPVRGVWGIGRCCSHGVRLGCHQEQELAPLSMLPRSARAVTIYHNPSCRAMIFIVFLFFNNACFNIAVDAHLSI